MRAARRHAFQRMRLKRLPASLQSTTPCTPQHDVEDHRVVAEPQSLVQLEVHLAAVHDLVGQAVGGNGVV